MAVFKYRSVFGVPILLAVFLLLLVIDVQSAPPQQQVLIRQIRSPLANKAHRFQSIIFDNPHLNYLKTDPHDVHINIDEVGSFEVFLT